VSAGKKIFFPAGDGMATAFPLKPEGPLELSIQLHRSYVQITKGNLLKKKLESE
jgi:hypothetical protein